MHTCIFMCCVSVTVTLLHYYQISCMWLCFSPLYILTRSFLFQPDWLIPFTRCSLKCHLLVIWPRKFLVWNLNIHVLFCRSIPFYRVLHENMRNFWNAAAVWRFIFFSWFNHVLRFSHRSHLIFSWLVNFLLQNLKVLLFWISLTQFISSDLMMSIPKSWA